MGSAEEAGIMGSRTRISRGNVQNCHPRLVSESSKSALADPCLTVGISASARTTGAPSELPGGARFLTETQPPSERPWAGRRLQFRASKGFHFCRLGAGTHHKHTAASLWLRSQGCMQYLAVVTPLPSSDLGLVPCHLADILPWSPH
ncbi:unnamed protein product [Rangifer tarandus platyrhynchus]|uniref:Uncharacterized protein n=3 Tax=Rangifer tarandus platyrhynchus TaxID=3082113 RepID=A0ABN8Y3H5_RANTA|nr:unnamed protein product [Rangifer tarandus platyrhynchus]CAI9693204.1 unnamed protein product [Rangifer tarandus platyrhynchus]